MKYETCALSLVEAWLNPYENNWYFINKWIVLSICNESLECDTRDLHPPSHEMKIKCNFHRRIVGWVNINVLQALQLSFILILSGKIKFCFIKIMRNSKTSLKEKYFSRHNKKKLELNHFEFKADDWKALNSFSQMLLKKLLQPNAYGELHRRFSFPKTF